MKLHKIEKIILLIFLLEGILLIVFALFFKNPCGSPCDTHSLLNPFGEGSPELCAQVCVPAHHPWFYPTADALIVKIVIYIIYLVIKLIRIEKLKKK